MGRRTVSVYCALGSVLSSVMAVAPAEAQTTGGSLRQAQDATTDLFARDRSISVRARPRPEYEALGLSVGAFGVFPKLELGLERNDNIYAVSAGEVGDWIWRVRPEVSVVSNWPRHSVSAYARTTVNRYQDYGSEDTEDWGVGGGGILDFAGRTTVSFGGDHLSAAEPRSSSSTPRAAVEPIEYAVTSAYAAAARTGGRLRLSGRADWRSLDYDDGQDGTGGVIQQDDRDRQIVSGLVRSDVAISPATAVFVQANANSRDYDLPSTAVYAARDSAGYEVLAGVNFEVGAVARGEVAAGYISQAFDDGAYGDVDGFGARGLLEWFPTQLTTVTLIAARTIEDSAIAGSGGYLSTTASLQIDHELLRNLIVFVSANVAADDYEGIDRSDERKSASVGATYFVNRRVGLSVTASTFDQSSEGASAGPRFDQNRLMLSLVTQF